MARFSCFFNKGPYMFHFALNLTNDVAGWDWASLSGKELKGSI